MSIDKNIRERAEKWTRAPFDKETREKVKKMLEEDPQEVIESFYKDLEFGTGGLRGIMGAGTNRVNQYTIGMATQGLANYLKKNFPEEEEIRVAVACDSRNNSPYFARITAEVFSANNIKVFLFDGLRPTPELSFAVRHLKCKSGVMITASHNPKEYNGYKAYWEDGAQVIPPHDKNIISEVENIGIEEVRFSRKEENITMIGSDVDNKYMEMVRSLSLSPEVIKDQKDLKIVFTPLHGTGAVLVPRALEEFGFRNIHLVSEQSTPDGDFPTVISPNPEEKAAMEMALDQAKAIGADLVMATDPDGDRVGIAVRDRTGDLSLLNGNQAASILIYYILKKWKENGKLTGNEYIVKTVVTSDLLNDIAGYFGVEHYDVLTGFKWIADIIRKNEGKKTFIAGGEESYGYMIGDFVRDKDAVSACALIAESAAWATSLGKGLNDILTDIYLQFGFYKEKLISIVRKGKSGSEEIRAMMDKFRDDPPITINQSRVVKIKDFLAGTEKDLVGASETMIDLPKSNVLQFFTEDGSKISVRPSGTEPKIKFYFSVNQKLESRDDLEMVSEMLDNRIGRIISDLEL